MALDTANRVIDKGRRMAVYAGNIGPLPGIQALECTTTQAIERFGEYDSEEQVVDVQVPENNGFIEMLDSEKVDFYQALMGLDESTDVVDVEIGYFSNPWVALNVWNKKKTKYIKSIFIKNPTFNNHPYPTSLNDATMMRFEFAASKFVKLPRHAIGIDKFTEASSSSKELTLSGIGGASRTPVALSDGTFVLGVAERRTVGEAGVTKYEWTGCTISESTVAGTVKVKRSNGGEFNTEMGASGNLFLVYYAYVPVEEGTAEWPGTNHTS